MVPKSILVDFSDIVYNSLYKLKYDKNLHLRYDILVGERIEQLLYGGLVYPMLSGRGEK